ncbi:MAG: hypothetical protein ACK4NS_05675 [Saprospiraceae bacterium]
MRQKSLKIIVWLWLFAFAFTATGISLHRVYCFCTDRTSWSLFQGHLDDESAGCNEARCCSLQIAEAPSCCLKPRALDPHPAQAIPASSDAKSGVSCASEDHACKSCTLVSYKLKADFLPDALKTIKFNCPAWLYDTPLLRNWVRPALCAHPIDPSRPYPPPSGRERCILHELFLC